MLISVLAPLLFLSRHVLGQEDCNVFKEGACPALDYCSFEQGTCGYGNFISDEFDWIRFRSSEESEFIAPPLDMTLESTEGHSFIAPIGGRDRGDSATFIPSLIPKKYQCLVFW